MRINKSEREYVGDVMSNFDHTVNWDEAKKLLAENTYGSYPAWDFHGSVWYENEQYHCEIWQYGSYQETISASTLEDIMGKASDNYGAD